VKRRNPLFVRSMRVNKQGKTESTIFKDERRLREIPAKRTDYSAYTGKGKVSLKEYVFGGGGVLNAENRTC